MCAETRCLALRLQGPLQSWGFDSQYAWRATGLMPTKSAVAGLCCAALGAVRGSERERGILDRFRAVDMLAVQVETRPVRRLQDFHTVLGSVSADNKAKPHAVLTRRHYVQDASYLVFLLGAAAFLEEAGRALQDPVWGLWLGRKACIPTAPVFAGVFPDRAEALRALLPRPLETYTHEEEMDRFADGGDSVPDEALSFDPQNRRFGVRRVARRRPRA